MEVSMEDKKLPIEAVIDMLVMDVCLDRIMK